MDCPVLLICDDDCERFRSLLHISIGCKVMHCRVEQFLLAPEIVDNVTAVLLCCPCSNAICQVVEVMKAFPDVSLYIVKSSYSANNISAISPKFNKLPSEYVYIVDALRRNVGADVCCDQCTLALAGELSEARKPSCHGIESAVCYIHRNIHNRKLLSTEIAEFCHYSIATFNRKFKERYGISCRVFMNSVRFHSAVLMLIHEGKSVESVCHSVGYCDVSYFIKVFKSKAGVTPAKFRNAK